MSPLISHTENSIDDLLRSTFEALNEHGESISPTRGPASELRGVRLELTDPRSRLSRSHTRGKVFSCLGELIWYLAGSSSAEHIGFYVGAYRDEAEPDGTVHAAYGHRLFPAGRLKSAIGTLETKPDSRQAVVPLLDFGDLERGTGHVPCTSTIQFMLRDGRVDAVVYMRSNDAFLGLPHDIFAFTMLQELVCRSVGAELGTYVHMVGSLHLYDEHSSRTNDFLNEGYSSFRPMPEMPLGDPWDSVRSIVAAERAIREGESIDADAVGSPYWADLVRLLRIYALTKQRGMDAITDIEQIRKSMSCDLYDVFLNDRFDPLEDD